MKKIYLGLITFMCLFLLFTLNSCTNDTSTVSSDTLGSAADKKVVDKFNLKKASVIPANSENPYDSDGRIYKELFETHSGSDSFRERNLDDGTRIDTIAGTDANVISYDSSGWSYIIENSDMTAAGKSSLIEFIHSFQLLYKNEFRYAELYDFVVEYEKNVLTNPTLIESDKKIILMTSSFGRHSTYMNRTESIEVIDPDWRKMVTHVIGDTTSPEF